MKKINDKRHEARIVALQALFEWSFNSTDIEDIAKKTLDLDLSDEADLEKKKEIDSELVSFLLKGTTENLDNIDKIIEKSAPEWPLEQIAKIDLEILRIAIFELYIARNVPPKVAIDEAVELGKQFGGENSSKFINGVLGTVVKDLMPEVTSGKNTGAKEK
jgi:N utilization substance protein B